MLAAILPSSNFLPFSEIYNINPIQHYNINPIKYLLLIAILPAVILNLFLKFIIVVVVWKGHPLQVRHKQDWGQGFIFLLPQAAVLPRSDAGSDVVKVSSSFVI